MSWITEAFCAYVCESFPVTSAERPQAPALISFVRLCLVCPCRAAAHQHVYTNQHMAPQHFKFLIFPQNLPGWTLLALLGWGCGAL